MADSAAFDAMEATLRETARGRWFLDEWSRRVRHGETEVLLQALARIERTVVTLEGRRAEPDPPPAPPLPDIDATLPILEATERVQEIAWDLREQGVASEVCDRLDAAASDIYAACAGHGPASRSALSPPASREGPGVRIVQDEASRSLPPDPHPSRPAVEPPSPLAAEQPANADMRPPLADADDVRPAPAGLAVADLARTARAGDADMPGLHERRRVST